MSLYPAVNVSYTLGRTNIEHECARGGSNTPYALLKKGAFTENQYDRYNRDRYDDRCTIGWKYGSSATTCINLNGFNWPAVDEPLLADLLARLLEQWKGTSFNSGVTIAEGKESVLMVRDTLLTLAKAVWALKKKDFKTFFRLLKIPRSRRKQIIWERLSERTAAAWLAAWFGWVPLVSDIYEAIKLIELVPRRKKLNTGFHNDGVFLQTVANADPTWVTDFRNRKARYLKVVVRNDPEWWQMWGLDDPASVLWEVIPLSFVIDWFLPIGNYLEALHACKAFKQEAYADTVVYEREAHFHIPQGAPITSYGIKLLDGPVEGHLRYFNMNRETGPFLTSLDLFRELPRAIVPKWSPSLWQVATAQALLVQRLRSLR